MQAPKSVLQGNPGKIHLDYLDGLRGIAALYVLLFHVVAIGGEVLPPTVDPLDVFRFGHEAVVVFIVLSGFLLALPVAQSPEIRVPGGLRAFFYRRARRILPGYYPALLIMPAYYAAKELARLATGTEASWDRVQSLVLSKDMGVHLLLLQNISDTWHFSGDYNPLLWSVATEWWIYFVFALVLVPIWRRWGPVAAAVASIMIGVVPSIISAMGYPSLAGFPHLLGAFGMGMLSAHYFWNLRTNPLLLAGRKAWGLVSLSLVVFLGLAMFAPGIRSGPSTRWITDYLVAFACALFILVTAVRGLPNGSQAGVPAFIVNFLASRPLQLLGSFSYSLYLTHLVSWAILGITLNSMANLGMTALSVEPLQMRILVLIPVQLLFAYVFYLLFERPFMRRRRPAR